MASRYSRPTLSQHCPEAAFLSVYRFEGMDGQVIVPIKISRGALKCLSNARSFSLKPSIDIGGWWLCRGGLFGFLRIRRNIHRFWRARRLRKLSGRWDLNPGPLGPEPSALAKLSYAPTSKIPTVDPLRTKSLKPPIHHGEIPSERSESRDYATPR